MLTLAVSEARENRNFRDARPRQACLCGFQTSGRSFSPMCWGVDSVGGLGCAFLGLWSSGVALCSIRVASEPNPNPKCVSRNLSASRSWYSYMYVYAVPFRIRISILGLITIVMFIVDLLKVSVKSLKPDGFYTSRCGSRIGFRM